MGALDFPSNPVASLAPKAGRVVALSRGRGFDEGKRPFKHFSPVKCGHPQIK